MIASPLATLAQSTDDLPGVTLTIDAIGDGGISGLAVLTPSDAGTAANVLVVGAPAGTTAVVHAGTCAAIDPTPVGLLGDVGAAGQLSTVIPVPYTTVADGQHLVAFHPGLDLATTLGCGQIPLVAASSPLPGGSQVPVASGDTGRYESAGYGFAIDWTAPWTQLVAEAVPGIDAVRLGDGTSEVVLAGHQVAGGDAMTCIRDWEGRLLESLRAGRIGDLAPVTGADGKPVGGGDVQRALGAYKFSLLTTDAPVGTIIERADCRRLSGDAVLEITVDIPADAIDAETAAVDALLAGVTTSGVVAPGTPSPGPATPAPTPAPTAAPTPTAPAGCAGMDTWVPATLARIDQLKGLATDAGAAMNNGMDAYARQLAANSLSVQELLLAQRRDVVPEAMRQVQEDLLRMYQLLADAYDLLAQAYRTGDSTILPDGLGKANEAESLSSSARRALREAASPCGITVPAA